MTLSLFDSYRQGLARLIEKLRPNHSQLSMVYVYQQRLTENLDRATRYGDTETLRSERAEVLDRLKHLGADSTWSDVYRFIPHPSIPE
jgi:hypothetical protein